MDWLPVKCELDALGVFTTIALNGSKSITLRADHIRSERTGIHSAVSVFYDVTRLAYDTFNLARNEERKRLATETHGGLGVAVQKAYPKEALKNDLDNFCAGIWEAWQEREPAVEIWTDKDVEPIPPKWLLEPFILESQPNILYGERSSLKSLTALVFATILSLQWEDNPFRIKPPSSYFETLYLDFERTEATARYNLSRLQRGHDLPGIPLHYKRLHGTLSRNAEWIRQYLGKHPKIKLVIVDSVTPASGGELNSSVGASDMFEADRSLNITSLYLAHASGKDPEVKYKTVIGHSAYESYASNLWECRKQQDEESSTADVCLYHRKPPAVYRLRKPIAYRIVFDEEHHSLATEHIDPKSIAEFIERMTLKTRILNCLKHQPLSTKEIAENLSEKVNTISVTILRLRANGAITEVEKDGKTSRWGLSHQSS